MKIAHCFICIKQLVGTQSTGFDLRSSEGCGTASVTERFMFKHYFKNLEAIAFPNATWDTARLLYVCGGWNCKTCFCRKLDDVQLTLCGLVRF